MAFLRVVEVFPPVFPFSRKDIGNLEVGERVGRFVESVRKVRNYGDLFLVASLKDPDLLKLSTVEAARILQARTGVDAAPVLVTRDLNRLEFSSAAVTALSAGASAVMLVWGDSYPKGVRATSVRDFSSLAEAVRLVAGIRRRSRSRLRILAPVDLRNLGSVEGRARAAARVRAGADYLLAQPPTTDPGPTFERHLAAVDGAGLGGRVLLNVFPIKNEKDLRRCNSFFGWDLSGEVVGAAKQGEKALLKVEREVVSSIKRAGLPGVYISTRGRPGMARRLLI